MTMPLAAIIRRMPKAELHLHIEGTLEPEMMFALAARNGHDLPYDSVEAVRRAYDFSSLQDFLDLYYQGMDVLRTEADFFDLTFAYLQRCDADNVVHVEIFFDPQGHLVRGVSFDAMMSGITRALDEGQKRFGITHRLIMSFLRHLSEENGFEVLDMAAAHRDRIFGVGLDSSENGFPPSKFARLFAACRDQGYHLFAHAGEEGPPAYVREAIDILGIERIDHGNRSLEDPDLVREIVARDLALTVCPLSNLKLRVVDDLESHPLGQMLEAGLRATINSDDPAYFGGYMTENYLRIVEALALDHADVRTLARNAFEASYLTSEDQAPHLDEIDRLFSDAIEERGVAIQARRSQEIR